MELGEESTERLRLHLRKAILEEINKFAHPTATYKNLLLVTVKELGFSETGFKCCLSGCRYKGERHREYVQHIKAEHPNIQNVLCNYQKECQRFFPNIVVLITHIKSEHSSVQQSSDLVLPRVSCVNVQCKCDRITCGQMTFQTIKSLVAHYNTFHREEDRECIFENCTTLLRKSSTSRHHFRIKHFNKNQIQLKTKYLVTSGSNSVVLNAEDIYEAGPRISDDLDDQVTDNFEDVYNENDFLIIEQAIPDSTNDYYLKYYADFLNNLANFKFVSQLTVQHISKQYLQDSRQSMQMRKSKLVSSLQSISSIIQLDIERIVKETLEDDPFLQAQMQLDTQHKLTKYVQDNMDYVAPSEIVLNDDEVKNGSKKDSLHYISIISSLKMLLEDFSFNKMMAQTRTSTADITDFKDCLAYKNNKYFQKNPDAYSLVLYSDGVEMKNPLGAARGTYKVVQVFYTLAEIRKSQRSQVDRLQLVMVFREKLLKKYSYRDILNCLVKDLSVLENGITIDVPFTRQVKFGVLAYVADNLEAHTLGGFSACFSSKDICRICHINYEQLETHIHDFGEEGAHDYWSIPEYDQIISNLSDHNDIESGQPVEVCEINPIDIIDDVQPVDVIDAVQPLVDIGDDQSVDAVEIVHLVDEILPYEELPEIDYVDDGLREITSDDSEESFDDENDNRGIKSCCPLNTLQSFHCVGGFPLDIMHDIFEGVVPQDILGILRILSSQHFFTIEQYNQSLKSLGYSSYESGDKPMPLPLDKKVKKLKGKALSICVHLRNFPLVIRSFGVDPSNDVLELGLKLHDIVERLMANEFREYEVDILEEKICDYLDTRKMVRSNFPDLMLNPKPKHHFLSHYGKMIRMFGPPVSYWTARFESKHCIAKSIAASSRNVINITKTLTERQQMRAASGKSSI